MQVPASGDGIKKLLAAEQEAQRIISEARKGAHLALLIVMQSTSLSLHKSAVSALCLAPSMVCVAPLHVH